MKKCCRCGVVKEYSEFGLCSYSKDKLLYACKVCKKEEYENRKAQGKIAEYKETNKERISEYNVAYQRKYRNSGVKQRRKLKMCEHKGGYCEHCGFKATENTIAAFDFHHIDPNTKDKQLSDMCLMKWDKIVLEMDKCLLLCSNCHRILHADNTVPSP